MRTTRRARHPLPRATVGVLSWHFTRSATTHALEIERATMAVLPGVARVPLAWAYAMINHVGLHVINTLADPTALAKHVDSTVAAMTAIRRSAITRADRRARVSLQISLGVEALDRGRLDEAVELLTVAVPGIDSIGDTGLRAYARMRLGRALVKAGRAPDAERFLLAARERVTHRASRTSAEGSRD